MQYKQLIFDVDDTLIDFAATEDFALHSLFDAHKWNLSTDLQKQYHSYNQGLWRDLELGKYTYDQISEMCFHDFLKDHLEIEVNGLAIMDEYRSYFGEAHKLLPGVEDTLIFAKKMGYKLTVLSNGEQFMQEHRLELAGIKQYFDLIVTSQQAHYQKPDIHAFDYFFSRTEIGPSETIFFGDGLQSDILGAEQYGFNSVWYNHRHRHNNLQLHPLFVVETYPEFVKLIQNDFQRVR